MREKIEKILEYLDKLEDTREQMLDISHRSIRKSSSAMAARAREHGLSLPDEGLSSSLGFICKILPWEQCFFYSYLHISKKSIFRSYG